MYRDISWYHRLVGWVTVTEMQPGWRKRTQSPSSPLCLENAGLDESRRVCCSLSMSQNNITMNIDVGLVGRDYSNQFHLPLFVFRTRFYASAREKERTEWEARRSKSTLLSTLPWLPQRPEQDPRSEREGYGKPIASGPLVFLHRPWIGFFLNAERLLSITFLS